VADAAVLGPLGRWYPPSNVVAFRHVAGDLRALPGRAFTLIKRSRNYS